MNSTATVQNNTFCQPMSIYAGKRKKKKKKQKQKKRKTKTWTQDSLESKRPQYLIHLIYNTYVLLTCGPIDGV